MKQAFWHFIWWCQFGSWRPFRDKCELCDGAKGGVPGNENRIGGHIVCDYCSMDTDEKNIHHKIWLKKFRTAWKKKFGEQPTPLEIAQHIPKNMSDGDDMTIMVEAMRSYKP